MPLPDPPGIKEEDLRAILSALDQILFRTPPAPEAAAPGPAPPARETPEPRPAYDLPTELELPVPEPPRAGASHARSPPGRPAGSTSILSLLPVEAIPPDTPKTQIRRIAVFCSVDCAAETAAVMSYLQEIGRGVAKPIFLTAVFGVEVDRSSMPAALAVKASLASAVASLVVVRDGTPARRNEWQEAMAKLNLPCYWIDPGTIRERALLIDIMTDLLLINPPDEGTDDPWSGCD